MDNRAIGIFDSGVGGLTCVAPILDMLPNERVIYFGDTARTPYGSKSPQTVREFSLQITDFLVSQGIKMLVIACNTVSATAIESLKQAHPGLPIIGTIEPAAKIISSECGSGSRIGVIATKLTIESRSYESAILRMNPELNISSLACPALVPLIEEGLTEPEIMDPVVRHYLDAFVKENSIDTLVLGCTHYPLIVESIRRCYPSIKLMNPSVMLANGVVKLLEEHRIKAEKKCGESIFYASDLSENFIRMIRNIDPCDKFEVMLRSL